VGKNKLGLGALRTTLAHEVLGHGIFYKIAKDTNPLFFDHGAVSLIEGWATWCEWYASDSPYGGLYRNNRIFSLRNFYEIDPARLVSEISKNLNRLCYSKDTIDNSIINYFQYPGFSYSYTIGALWFEDKFSDNKSYEKPYEFFEMLNGGYWGDFFCLW